MSTGGPSDTQKDDARSEPEPAPAKPPPAPSTPVDRGGAIDLDGDVDGAQRWRRPLPE